MDTLALVFYILLALFVIGSLLSLIRLIILIKKRAHTDEHKIQGAVTLTGLLIGLSLVIGLIANIFGNYTV